MELTGTIKLIRNEKQVSDSFKKRELILSTDEQYSQDIQIEFVQDKCDILDNYSEGQSIKVSINIRGREWTSPEGDTVYFNTIQGWRIEAVNSPQTEDAIDSIPNPDEEKDDLPF